jgi:hypothetical protein
MFFPVVQPNYKQTKTIDLPNQKTSRLSLLSLNPETEAMEALT